MKITARLREFLLLVDWQEELLLALGGDEEVTQSQSCIQ
jgi:hypothetical protein